MCEIINLLFQYNYIFCYWIFGYRFQIQKIFSVEILSVFIWWIDASIILRINSGTRGHVRSFSALPERHEDASVLENCSGFCLLRSAPTLNPSILAYQNLIGGLVGSPAEPENRASASAPDVWILCQNTSDLQHAHSPLLMGVATA